MMFEAIVIGVVLMAEVIALCLICSQEREIKKERLALAKSWEDLAKTAGEVVQQVGRDRVEEAFALAMDSDLPGGNRGPRSIN